MEIEDFLAGDLGDKLRQLPTFAGGGAVSRLQLDDLACRCRGEGEELVARQYLCPDELTRWRSFQLPKRRLEWLGGRIVAKDAAMRFCGVSASQRDWQQWQLAVLPSGRPELAEGVTAPLPEISISHSGNQAVAMATACYCGIDIQQRRDSVVRVKSRFCQAVEEERLAASLGEVEDVTRLTLLWAAKEAIRKAVVLPVLPAFDEMELTAVDGKSTGLMVFDCCFRRQGETVQLAVGVVLDGEHAVALVALPATTSGGEM